MYINRILFLFLALFFTAGHAHAIFGLEGRREQRQMISDARSAYENGEYYLAIDIMDDFLLKNAPKRRLKRAYIIIGSSYKALGAYDKALLKYTEAIEFFPDDIDLNLALADIYTIGGLSDKAVALYQKVLQLENDNMPARLALARAYLASGSFVRAAKYFEEYTLSVKDVPASVYYDYARSYFHANEYDKALAMAFKSEALAKGADTMFLIAKIYKAGGRNDEAYEKIKETCGLYSRRDDIYLTMALWLAFDERYTEEGAAHARAYLKKNPSNRLALFIKSFSDYNRGDKKGAYENLKTIADGAGNGFIEKTARSLLKVQDSAAKATNLKI